MNSVEKQPNLRAMTAQPSRASDSPREPDDARKDDERRSALMSCMIAISEFIRVDRVLGGQLPAARSDFFGLAVAEHPAPARAQRFLEWFALERRAEGSGGPPVRAFLAAGCPGLEAGFHSLVEALADSVVGIWAIRDIEDGLLELESATAAGANETPIRACMPGSKVAGDEALLEIGQSLAGRLVQIPQSGLFCVTEAAVAFPGLALFDAYAFEVQRHHLAGRHVPLTQLELEQVLVAYEEAQGESPEQVAGELSDFLRGATVNTASDNTASEHDSLPSVEEISYALSVTPSPGQVLGPFLEKLAISTDLAIEQAQRLLLRLWNAHQAQQQATVDDAATVPDEELAEDKSQPEEIPEDRAAAMGEPTNAETVSLDSTQVDLPPEQLGQAVLNELEKGLAEGEAVESLFGRIEEMLGESPDSDATPELGVGQIPEELHWHSADDGDLSALVEEYLWERGHGEHPASSRHAEILRGLAESFVEAGLRSVCDLRESAMAASLVEDWVHGARQLCLERLEVMMSWNEWLLACQEIELGFDLAAFRTGLERAQQRCQALEEQLIIAPAQDQAASPWRVEGRTEEGWELRANARKWTLPLACGQGAGTGEDEALELGDILLGVAVEAGFAAGLNIVPSLLASSLDIS